MKRRILVSAFALLMMPSQILKAQVDAGGLKSAGSEKLAKQLTDPTQTSVAQNSDAQITLGAGKDGSNMVAKLGSQQSEIYP